MRKQKQNDLDKIGEIMGYWLAGALILIIALIIGGFFSFLANVLLQLYSGVAIAAGFIIIPVLIGIFIPPYLKGIKWE